MNFAVSCCTDEHKRLVAMANSLGLTKTALVRLAVRAITPRVLEANALHKERGAEDWAAALERAATERILSGDLG